MTDKLRVTSRSSSISKLHKNFQHDEELYALWRTNLETSDQDRKFKVRSKFQIDASLNLISGNLMMAYFDSASTTPSSSRSSIKPTTPTKPDEASNVFDTPDQADIAIIDTPTKKKRAQLRKNLNKLLQKFQNFQRNNTRQEDDSFGPTYHKYQYNCSLYDHLDQFNSSEQYNTCIPAM